MHISREVRIETVTTCKYNCIMCPREAITRGKEVMGLETFVKVLDKLEPYKHIELITFAGHGESFLDPTLMEKILETKARDYKIHLITTGYNLNQTLIDTICIAGVEELRFSFYAMDSIVYKEVHGFDGMEKALNNIKEVLRRKLGTRPKVILEFIKLKENEHQLHDWLSFWKDKADVIEAWHPHNWATPIYDYRELNKKDRRSCGRPTNGPYQVQVDGTMSVCCFDFDNKLKIGNLLKQTLRDIMTGEPMKRIQESHEVNDYKNLICDNCDQLQDHPDACIFTNAVDEFTNPISNEDRVLITTSGLDIIRK